MDPLNPSVLEATTGAPPSDGNDVANIAPHDVDPAYSIVTYVDGRKETMPTAQAKALPQAPPAAPTSPVVGTGIQPQGDEFAGLDGAAAAPPPSGDPARDTWLQQQSAEGFSPVGVFNPGNSLTPSGPMEYHTGDTFHPAGIPPPADALPEGSPGALPPARIDPGAAIVPADPDATPTADETDVTTNQTVANPGALMANTLGTADEQAARLDTQERGKQAGASVENQAAIDAKTQEASRAWQDAQLARIHTEEAKKAVDIVESTPIETDFFKGSPGRQVGAWVALAVSGFLQGATRGANPVLDQMMRAISTAQERFIQDQRQDKASKLAIRTKAFGDAQVAEASMRMQLGKIFTDHAMLQAKQFGLDALPPAVSATGAKMQVDAAQSASVVGMHVERTTQEKFKELQAHPDYAAAHELAALLGPDAEKKHAHAMDPTGTGLDLPGKIGVADQIQDIKGKLQALAAKHGGELPQQNTVSYDTLGMAPLATRMGSSDAADQVEGRRLLEKLKLMVSSAGSSRLYDSEGDQKRLNKTLDTGTTAQTLAAIDEMQDQANRKAIGVAAGVSHNPQGYIDFVRRTLGSNPGVEKGPGVQLTPTVVQRAAPTPSPGAATTGGGPTPSSPLAPLPSASAPGSPTAESNNPMDLKTLQALRTDAAAAGKNGDAITRVVRFEFGAGKPNASGATGLVQWMPDTFKGMTKPPGYENVTHADLKDLTPEEQVPLAVHYFKGFPELGPDSDVGDYYLAVAAPAALRGHWPDTKVVYSKDPDPKSAWSMNPAWRPTDGGDITVGSIKARARKF